MLLPIETINTCLHYVMREKIKCPNELDAIIHILKENTSCHPKGGDNISNLTLLEACLYIENFEFARYVSHAFPPPHLEDCAKSTEFTSYEEKIVTFLLNLRALAFDSKDDCKLEQIDNIIASCSGRIRDAIKIRQEKHRQIIQEIDQAARTFIHDLKQLKCLEKTSDQEKIFNVVASTVHTQSHMSSFFDSFKYLNTETNAEILQKNKSEIEILINLFYGLVSRLGENIKEYSEVVLTQKIAYVCSLIKSDPQLAIIANLIIAQIQRLTAKQYPKSCRSDALVPRQSGILVLPGSPENSMVSDLNYFLKRQPDNGKTRSTLQVIIDLVIDELVGLGYWRFDERSRETSLNDLAALLEVVSKLYNIQKHVHFNHSESPLVRGVDCISASLVILAEQIFLTTSASSITTDIRSVTRIFTLCGKDISGNRMNHPYYGEIMSRAADNFNVGTFKAVKQMVGDAEAFKNLITYYAGLVNPLLFMVKSNEVTQRQKEFWQFLIELEPELKIIQLLISLIPHLIKDSRPWSSRVILENIIKFTMMLIEKQKSSPDQKCSLSMVDILSTPESKFDIAHGDPHTNLLAVVVMKPEYYDLAFKVLDIPNSNMLVLAKVYLHPYDMSTLPLDNESDNAITPLEIALYKLGETSKNDREIRRLLDRMITAVLALPNGQQLISEELQRINQKSHNQQFKQKSYEIKVTKDQDKNLVYTLQQCSIYSGKIEKSLIGIAQNRSLQTLHPLQQAPTLLEVEEYHKDIPASQDTSQNSAKASLTVYKSPASAPT